MLFLTRRKSASIDNIGSLLLDIFIGLGKRRTGQGHQAGPGGLKDTERCDELHEGVDTVRLGRAIVKLWKISTEERKVDRITTYISTMQLLVLISNILPPN